MSYQIIYQGRGSRPFLISAAACGQLFNPPLDAAAFECWARVHNCPPDGAIVRNGSIVGPGWIRGRVRVRRHSVEVATIRKVQRWKRRVATITAA